MTVEITKYGNFATALVHDEGGRKAKLDIGNRGLRIDLKDSKDDVILLVGDDLRQIMETYLEVYRSTP